MVTFSNNQHIIKTCMVITVFITLIILTVYFCYEPYPVLKKILAEKKITLITRNNSHCYYNYRGTEMGFEYDLAKAFAEYLGVKLNVKVAEKWNEMIPELIEETGAFIGASMTITPSRKEQVKFSDGYLTIQQHIIVNRKNWKIKNIRDLAGKEVYIRQGTSYQEQLEQIKKSGVDITIKTLEDISTQELIADVADGKIDITIADTNIALLNRRYYPNIIITGTINEKEPLGWAVAPNAPGLLNSINSFFAKIKNDGTFDKIYNRYYSDVESFDYVDLRVYHIRLNTRLPKYKKIIMTAAERNGFDWRLIAAQAYQESHFDSEAKSYAGACGLMQLTRSTAKSLGVEDITDPEQNINAGVNYLKNLYSLFDMVEGEDRMYVALAAYNVGQGHIYDARRLAKKMGLDPHKWHSMEITLPLLQKSEFYKASDVKYGYCRGTEPIQYIKQIMKYYDILKQQGVEYEYKGLVLNEEKEASEPVPEG